MTTRPPYRTSGERIVAAICCLRVALTAVAPDSPHAAAPMPTPPADWPFDQALWHPRFSDPAAMLVEAGRFMEMEHDLLTEPSSFDDAADENAPSRST